MRKPISFEVIFGEQEYKCCIIDIPNDCDHKNISENTYQLYSKIEYTPDLLIIRPQVDIPLYDISHFRDIASNFIDRFGTSEIRFLYSSNYAHIVTENYNISINKYIIEANKHGDFIALVRQHELKLLARSSSAILKGRKGVVYKTPSGTLARSYLRAGNIQTTTTAIDACFFWIIPYLKNCNSILTETWSISSLGISTIRYAERYARISGNDVVMKYDTLSSYIDDSPHSVNDIRDALFRILVNGEVKVLFLISAVMTGRCLENLKNAINSSELPMKSSEFVTIFKLNSQCGISALCDLSDEKDINFTPVSLDSIGLDRVINIDNKTYFPVSFQETSVSVNKPIADEHKKFYDSYTGIGAFSLHMDKDIHERKHHYGIYINVSKVLTVQCFYEKLKAIILNYAFTPNRIIIRGVQGALDLANAVSKILNKSIPIHRHSGIYKDNNDPAIQGLDILDKSENILIIDDAAAQGNQLRQYSKLLREARYNGRIRYLVGIARPERDSDWKELKSRLGHRNGSNEKHTLDHVEKILLPKWDNQGCPWCQEQYKCEQLINKNEPDNPLVEMLAIRLMHLNGHRNLSGLQAKVFWRSEPASPLKLTDNSVFTEKSNASEADVVAAVASALQIIRQGPDNARLEFTNTYVGLLSYKNYLGIDYTDNIIICSFWRCCNPHDLTSSSTDLESERKESSEKLLYIPGNLSELFLEYYLSFSLGKMPDITINNKKISSKEDILSLLHEALQGKPDEKLVDLSINRQNESNEILPILNDDMKRLIRNINQRFLENDPNFE